MQFIRSLSEVESYIKDNFVSESRSSSLNVNIRRKSDGWTPLRLAISEDEVEMAYALVSHGANVNSKDCLGKSLLWAATLHGNLRMVRLLVNSGANLANDIGIACLKLAVERNYIDIMLELIQAGINYDISLAGGQNLLHIAAMYDHVHALNILLKLGLNYNLQDNNLDTPINLAVKYGHKIVVDVLVRTEDVDLHKTDILGNTPLDNARLQKHDEVVEILSLGINRRELILPKSNHVGILSNETSANSVVETIPAFI